MWNCCKSAPASVVTYDDGSASVTCQGCGLNFARHYGSDRLSALPSDWKPTTINEQAIRMAEAIQSYYFDVAGHETYAVAGGDGETYRNANTALLAGYRAAWPHLDPQAIYEAWLDCNESATYCARIVAQQLSDNDRNGHYIQRVLPDLSEVWLDSGEIVDATTTDAQRQQGERVGDFECCNLH